MNQLPRQINLAKNVKLRPEKAMGKDKSSRANSSQFFVAGELCRRGYTAVVTLGNCPNTDILCSNVDGTRFVHVQVKTFIPGSRTCSVGIKAEKDYGANFFWILCGIPLPEQLAAFEYYIIPSKEMAKNVKEAYELWLKTPGKNGQAHRGSAVRTVHLPPLASFNRWSIAKYKDRWDLIEERLNA
jgi:hypothetical protein